MAHRFAEATKKSRRTLIPHSTAELTVYPSEVATRSAIARYGQTLDDRWSYFHTGALMLRTDYSDGASQLSALSCGSLRQQHDVDCLC
jgi:hypothetical protein